MVVVVVAEHHKVYPGQPFILQAEGDRDQASAPSTGFV